MEMKDAVQQFILDKKDMRNFSKVAREKMETLLGQHIVTEVHGKMLEKFGLKEAVEVCPDCKMPKDSCDCDKKEKDQEEEPEKDVEVKEEVSEEEVEEKEESSEKEPESQE